MQVSASQDHVPTGEAATVDADAPYLLPWLLGIATTATLLVVFELLVMPGNDGGFLGRDLLRFVLWGAAAVGGVSAAGGVLVGRARPEVPDVPEAVEVSEEVVPDDGELVASDRLASQVLDQMSEGMLVFDGAGRLVVANLAASRLLGIRSLPPGVPMRVLGTVPRLRTTLVEALRSREVVERTLDVPKGPADALLARAVPVHFDGEEGVALALLDVSSIRRMEGRWKRFASDAAHELRTPAAAVISNLEVLGMMAEDAEDESGRRYLDAASRQAHRMGQLVDKLMQLVRMEGPAPLATDEVQVDEVFAAVREEWDGADAGTAARLEVEGCGATALGDQTALHQVVHNLVSNALRYSAGPVSLRCRCTDALVCIEVEDRGPGIPEDFREAVFERFVRVDVGRAPDAGGTGLGLAIVRELVEGMGGSVRALGAEPNGTRMQVELPRAAGELDGADAAP